MNKNTLIPTILGAAFTLACSIQTSFGQSGDPTIAFLSDVHLQDVYADLKSKEFKGVLHPINGKFATIRTMKSQLNSTRLFNENYFAFIQALEDLKQKGILWVVLPGDFTDDGQPMNVMALKSILDRYSNEAGMRFFLTTGNHDPVKPYGGIAGKRDFLGVNGAEQAIAGSTDFFQSTTVAKSDQINYWGYPEITLALASYGFFPHPDDLFWAHPFEEIDYENYEFERAKANSTLENRMYTIGHSEGLLPDASYVVEPMDGVWLLALDGNVYTQSENGNWNGSSVGFNQASIYKKHQLDWIQKVVEEAKKRHKTLISFSHYPLVEFHDGASEEMKSLFGQEKFQLARVPSSETSQQYAETGLQLHFAGHMHINDTGIYQDQLSDNTLYNIQVPSLAAFPAAYKTIQKTGQNQFEIQTIPLTEVDHMNEFFDLYRMEHRWLLENQRPGIWDSTILASKDYAEYTENHLKELTKSRFIPSDWPKSLVGLLQTMNEQELMDWSKMNSKEGELFLSKKISSKESPISGTPQMIEDFYLLKNGDELGKKLIPSDRITFYKSLFSAQVDTNYADDKTLGWQLTQFIGIFQKLFHSLPADHFQIDLNQRTIEKKD
ncbi:metallophosphoesterase [Algoriphagus lutimaris]|uniref:metallophosphoesterase family protein n=1 Tax=Algoriphagus lutimaris TaxID=613197 RepID=UPI00196AC144|nr:metallophosphoesterase [Algoriphagus lutimaris]MBN3519375.1 metallophosphoesterase [Algoriphagus lutimaris]